MGCVRMARVEGGRTGKVRSFDSTASTEEEAEENVEEDDKEEEEEQAEEEEEEVGTGPWLVEGTGLRQSLCVGARIEA